MPDSINLNTFSVINNQNITGNTTINIPTIDVADGTSYTYLFLQDSTGSHDIDFDTGVYIFPASVTLPLTAAGDETNMVKFIKANGLYIYEVDNVLPSMVASLPGTPFAYYRFESNVVAENPGNYFTTLSSDFTYGTVGLTATGFSTPGGAETRTGTREGAATPDAMFNDVTISYWIDGATMQVQMFGNETASFTTSSSLTMGISTISHSSSLYDSSQASSYSASFSYVTGVRTGIHHVVFRRERTGVSLATKAIFYDGVKVKESTSQALVLEKNTAIVKEGIIVSNTIGGPTQFDNLVIYNSALTDQECIDLFNFEKSNYIP